MARRAPAIWYRLSRPLVLDVMSPDLRVHYSCVMAGAPRFAQQTLTLVATLIDLAGVAPAQIVVHPLDDVDPRARRQLESLGIAVAVVEPFHHDFPHCNKLRQLENRRFDDGALVVLCDTDLAFTGPLPEVRSSSIRAKVVDLPNPPLEMWTQVAAAAGLDGALDLSVTSFGNHPTPTVNCNGGLYVLPGATVPTLREAWPRWTRWLIDRPDLLAGPYRVHVDQVGFGLALLERRLPLEHLPLASNYPTHAWVQPKPDVTPGVLHYHDHVDASGFLDLVGQPLVDAQIRRVNDTIRHWRRTHFDNASFWNFRYAHAPALGSGVGSRGEHLNYKQARLLEFIPAGASVLDVGCGDLEVSRVLPNVSYTGIDVSQEAVSLAAQKRPDWRFLAGPLHDLDLRPHDVVVCFDVLIHQRSEAEYRSLIGSLIRLATRDLIVSGYEESPQFQSEMTYFHEPLSVSLTRLAGSASVKAVGQYRDTTIMRVVFPESVGDPSVGSTLRGATEHITPTGRFLSRPGDLISGQFETFGGHTRNELAMVRSLVEPRDVVVDVGAHIGSFAVPLAMHVGPSGVVLAVEPHAGNLELLFQNIVRNDVADRVRVASVVATDADATFRGVPDPTNSGALYFTPEASGDATGCAVDALVEKQIRPRRVSLIKIDVEGLELSVLRSAARTIELDRPIIYCEVVEAQLARQGNTPADLDHFLRSRRYRFFRNRGERNSTHDRFEIVEMASLAEGGGFFDCLAIPEERTAALRATGRLPA